MLQRALIDGLQNLQFLRKQLPVVWLPKRTQSPVLGALVAGEALRSRKFNDVNNARIFVVA